MPAGVTARFNLIRGLVSSCRKTGAKLSLMLQVQGDFYSRLPVFKALRSQAYMKSSLQSDTWEDSAHIVAGGSVNHIRYFVGGLHWSCICDMSLPRCGGTCSRSYTP